ncbi:MAG: RnfABCDGE type electron transport complex subunit D [Bacilli bacterium]|nr:RnfABCDGE type electron transport complex subunit D [Bacilli bacterium]
MKNSKTSDLVLNNIYLLIPLIIYGIFKNGYLIYEKGLINIFMILKPLYLVLIGFIVKIIIDLIKYKKVKIDYNLIYVIVIGMIMPYNINILLYIATFTLTYIFSLFLEKYIKVNKVCLMYLIIVLVNVLFNEFTFMSILEQNYVYRFDFFDLLIGRCIGGISSTSILFSLIAYTILINNYYYKKEIPFVINITYLALAFIYFIITNNSNLLLNSELIFASVFVCTLPEYSPYKEKNQIVYGIMIALIAFIISMFFNSILSIYIATLILSLMQNITIRQKKTKLPIADK